MYIIKEVSLVIGILLAIYSINSWQREHNGKRRIELAEETLALFYEARDVIAQIRNPVSFSHETNDIEQGKEENEKSFNARRQASIVYIRYNEHKELFNKIRALRYRFMAQIGKKEAEPFDELTKVVDKIFTASRALAMLWARDDFSSDEEFRKNNERVKKYEEIFWNELSDKDSINMELETLIKNIESTCKKVIFETGIAHNILNCSYVKRLTRKFSS